ncbi:putative thioesterase PNKD [Mantella aurantiaca]
MVAPCVRMLVSRRVWSSCGVLQGAGGGVRGGGVTSSAVTPWRAPDVQCSKALHSRSPARQRSGEEDSGYKGSFFVAGAKAKNPMKKVGFAWAIGFPSGILLFLFAKKKVNERRLAQMKAWQRMRDANKGQYESERYRPA